MSTRGHRRLPNICGSRKRSGGNHLSENRMALANNRLIHALEKQPTHAILFGHMERAAVLIEFYFILNLLGQPEFGLLLR